MTEGELSHGHAAEDLKEQQDKQAAVILACAAILASLPETARVNLSRLDQVIAGLVASGQNVGAAEGEAKKAAAHIMQAARRHLEGRR